MIKKDTAIFIVLCIVTLFSCAIISSKATQKRYSLFNAVDAEDAEIMFQDTASTHKDPYMNVSKAHSVETNILPKDLFNPDMPPALPENEEFFENFNLPKSFEPDEEEENKQEQVPKSRDEDGSPFIHSENDDRIEFHFEDADIQNLLSQIEEIFEVNFITDEILNPVNAAGKTLKGLKISFKTHAPLTRKDAWNLFLTFIDLAGFAVVPQPEPNIYRITTSDKAQQSPVPTFIGTPASALPDNDQMIRFVYFIENADMQTLREIVSSLKSPSSRAILLQEIKALVITDRAYNIKSLMQIIQELDQVSMPQSMSVLKLRSADVNDVKKLYDAVASTGEMGGNEAGNRLFGARKQSASIYFPENVRLITDPRTNSLIILGAQDAIKKIEDFIMKYVDVELEKPYSPLQTYQLHYASASTVAEIMNNMSQFGSDTPAGRAGGVRGGDKYLKPIVFVPEPATNTLVIKGDYDDYLRAIEIIKRLDEPQPQVAIESLILTLDFDENKQLGSQIRNKIPGPNGLLGNNVEFQTSGLALGQTPSGILTNPDGPGAERLLANLINLVVDAPAGNTVVSLGADAFGVWGIFNILQTVTNVQVVSNPFLVATNKTKAKVSVGEIRRVVTSNVIAGSNNTEAFGDFSAQLTLEVTPQINSDGMIVLKLDVLIEDFISSASNVQVAAKLTRNVDTRAIVADKEVIAIGGLVENQIRETLTKVPILGDIPILGWLFRNKGKDVIKKNLLILISTHIIEPEVSTYVDEHTESKLTDYYNTVENYHDSGEYRDPVYRRFFENKTDDPMSVVEDFFFERRRDDNGDFSTEKTPSKPSHTTKDGKFYRPGAKKDAAVVLPPASSFEDIAKPTVNDRYTPSDLMKKMMLAPKPVLAQKKPRRRDARRGSCPSEKPSGVTT